MLLVTLLWTLLFLGLLWVLPQLRRHILLAKNAHKVPGPARRNWFLGNLVYLQDNQANVFRTVRKWGLSFYPIYKIWIGHMVGVCILSPEDYELVLSSIKHIDKGPVYDLLHKWLRTGLLTSSGNKWQLRRKILTPAFHFSILQQFIAIFNDETQKLVEILKEECGKPWTDVVPLVSQFTLKTIGETAMGTEFNFTTKREISYKKAITSIGTIYLYKVFRPYYYFNPFFRFLYLLTPTFLQETRLVRTLHDFTKSVISERQREFKQATSTMTSTTTADISTRSKRKGLAMLDLLLSVKSEEGLIDDDGIREEVDTFMFEGHDTTSVAISFALMLIACHKNFQVRIVEEIKEVLGDIRKKPTYNDLQNLKYLERCIKEVLRLYPSVQYISRRLGDDLVTSTGYHLRKGTIIHLHIYDLHHNPNIYPDPEKFDPDRFLPENCQKRHPFAYVPFSAGPRNCIGQKFALLELKAVLCGILVNFVLEPVDTPSTVVPLADLVLRAQYGVKVRFIPRSA